MATTPNTIDHATLERLVEAGAVRGAVVVGQAGGWGVVIQYGMTERALAAKRGAVRVFRKFETLVGYLKDIGITRYQVDASQFDPVAHKTERKRVDAAERMKAAHEAAAYNEWLVKQVQESIDDLRPNVSHEQVLADWQIKRAALLDQANRKGV
ncbi:hypothetical protein [Methylobacter luteus]|uniref:hypothetical protein n=1 Tax=Methylobacter luteus TaxID=415 RepID=UPI0004140EA4|nr:hypothetical protein [Methylobacter luteus]